MTGRNKHETTVLIPWKKEEDKVLLQIILDSMKEGVKLTDAFEIAADATGRTMKGCQQRWAKQVYQKNKKAYIKAKEEGRSKKIQPKKSVVAVQKEVVIVPPSTTVSVIDEVSATEHLSPNAVISRLIAYSEFLEQKNKSLENQIVQLTEEYKKTLQLLVKNHQ